MTSEKEIA